MLCYRSPFVLVCYFCVYHRSMWNIQFLYVLQLASVKGQRDRARQGKGAGSGEKAWDVNGILDKNLRQVYLQRAPAIVVADPGTMAICGESLGSWSFQSPFSAAVRQAVVPLAPHACTCSPELGRDVASAEAEIQEMFLTMGCYFGTLMYILATKPKPKFSGSLLLSHIYTCRSLMQLSSIYCVSYN